MPLVLWDASGLVKRYLTEIGSETVDALFAALPARDMTATPWGYVETYSILLRRYNSGAYDQSAFQDAVTALQAEVAGNPDFGILSVSDATIFSSLSLMHAHNLNSADAVILSAYLGFRRAQPAGAPPCLVVASDKRLLRAAHAEGLATLNPELLPAVDLSGFLAAL